MPRKKKNTKNANTNASIKRGGIRFNKDTYFRVNANMENIPDSTIITEVDGVETEYSLGGSTPPSPVYIKDTLWENPQPTKSLSVSTKIIDGNIISDYEYFEIEYRNINNSDLIRTLTFTYEDIYNDNMTFALISTGDYDESLEHSITLARAIYAYDGIDMYVDGNCYRIDNSTVIKNFRAIPIVVYGYKRSE